MKNVWVNNLNIPFKRIFYRHLPKFDLFVFPLREFGLLKNM